MPRSGEYKTVQVRILTYAEAIGWTFVPREEAWRCRGFDPDVSPKDRAKGAALFFDDLFETTEGRGLTKALIQCALSLRRCGLLV